MAYVREGINAHVREHIEKHIRSSFVSFNPLFYFLGMSKPDGMNDLGRPKTGAVFGGKRMTGAQQKTTLGSPFHQIRFAKAEPNDGGTITFGGATPTAAAFAEDNFGTAETRWTHYREPYSMRKHTLEFAKGADAVANVVDDSIAPVWERFVKRINADFWAGTLTGAQQANNVWSSVLGLTHTGTTNNTYGRVDRSVETALNPLVINAATQLPSTVVSLDINRKVNVGFVDALGATIQGLATKSSNGTGPTLFLTTPALWNELANQADGRFQIHLNGIPEAGIGGFKFPIIQQDNVFYVWDPTCPAGTMVGLNLDEWCVEVQEGHNFINTPLVDKAETEQGGEYIMWGSFDAMLRLTCRAPDIGIVRITGLTTV